MEIGLSIRAPKDTVQILCLFDAISKAGAAGVTDVNVPMAFENNTGHPRKTAGLQGMTAPKLVARQEFARCRKVFAIF